MARKGTDTVIPWEEIRRHNTDRNCWVVMYGEVLDVTDFLSVHPGGLDPICDQGGYDITSSFESIGHSSVALEKARSFKIGLASPAMAAPTQKTRSLVPESTTTTPLGAAASTTSPQSPPTTAPTTTAGSSFTINILLLVVAIVVGYYAIMAARI